jgi:hypothetical protein
MVMGFTSIKSIPVPRFFKTRKTNNFDCICIEMTKVQYIHTKYTHSKQTSPILARKRLNLLRLILRLRQAQRFINIGHEMR